MADYPPEDEKDQQINAIALTVVIVLALILLISAFLWAMGALNPIMEDFISGSEPTVEASPAETPTNGAPTPSDQNVTPTSQVVGGRDAEFALVYWSEAAPLPKHHQH